jgi:hypothetical protein
MGIKRKSETTIDPPKYKENGEDRDSLDAG